MQAFLDSFAPFFDALTGFSADALFTGNLGSTFTWVAVILTVVGLVQAFFGQPLLRIELMLGGIAAGLFLGNLIVGTGVFSSFLTESWMHWTLGIIIGLLIGVAALYLIKPAFFVAAAFVVFPFIRTALAMFITNNVVNLIVAIVAALLIAAISIKLFKTMVVLVTAAFGAFSVSFALSGYLSMIPYINLILLGVVFIVGVAVQARFALRQDY